MEENAANNNPVIVNFYSYKGGVGRTMMLAQFARLLSALEKNVIIIDLDFDAPGIPVAFEKAAEVRGGFLSLFHSYEKIGQSGVLERDLKEKFKEELDPDLNNFLIKIPAEEKINDRGSIKLLPCGNLKEGYWDKLSKDEWVSSFTERDGEVKAFKFVDDYLIPSLGEAGADYILIDSRSGVTGYGKLGWHMAHRQVVICCPNDESRDMITGPLKTVFNSKHFLDNNNLFFVVSRMPPELGKEAIDSFEEMKKTILDGFENIEDIDSNKERIFQLNSDLDTLIDPQIRKFDRRYDKVQREIALWKEKAGRPVKKKEKGEIVKLHEDLLSIFVNLFHLDPGNDKTTKESIQDIWNDIYNEDFYIDNRNRLFGFNPNTGEMLNPGDHNRNIAFKTETFIKFINRFYEVMQGMRSIDGKDEPIDLMNSALFNAGKQCGEDFATSLTSTSGPQIDIKSSEFEVKVNNIDEWCKFDMDAGFGQMTCPACDPDELEITLRVENLFVINSIHTDSRDYSSFFTGYVVGVSSIIIKPYTLDNITMIKLVRDASGISYDGDFQTAYLNLGGNKFKNDFFERSGITDNGILYKIKLKPLKNSGSES